MTVPDEGAIPDLSAKLPPLIPRRRKPTSQEAPLEPAPETPELPNPPKQLPTSILPCRRILSPNDMGLFHESDSYKLILGFVFGISDSVQGQSIRQVKELQQDEQVGKIMAMLLKAEELLKENPPLDTGSRFGNPVFRSYLSAIKAHMDEWHTPLQVPKEYVPELSTYLEHCFGSGSRIDYGSGHELNFFMWLLCLNRLSLLPTSTFPSLALVVFPRYLQVMRAVQSTYYLEPAGSHGVWGLDDYQFLPFLFGASQLINHKYITPKSIHSQPTIEECRKDYLYLDQVAFVNSVKNVEGLRWHSPMLDDISSAKNWTKIEAGMKKMFVKEVLGKLPVMQHFLFGSLIPAAEGMTAESDAHEEDCEHQHDTDANSWSDCCGIKVPSSLGAAGEMKKRMGGEGLRRIPFD